MSDDKLKELIDNAYCEGFGDGCDSPNGYGDSSEITKELLLWSDMPPTEDGYYWCLFDSEYLEPIIHVCINGLVSSVETGEHLSEADRCYQWRPAY